MSYCDTIISKDIKDVTCGAPAVKGYERLGIIVNRADIDFGSVAFSSTAKNALTALPLKTGKKGYTVEQNGTNPFTGTNASLNVGTYKSSFNRNVSFVILNNDGDLLDSISNGEFVVVLQNKDKGTNNTKAFSVFGLHNGLVASAIEIDHYGDAYSGGVITLTETDAPMCEVYLGETYTAGKALFDSLLEVAE